MTLTDKQKDIIKTLNLGYERGHLLDLDELLEVLPYKTTKQSIQFSIRALIRKGIRANAVTIAITAELLG